MTDEMIKTMTKITLLVSLMLIGSSTAGADSGSACFSLGTNIWGYTASLEYRLPISTTFALGISYGSGSFNLAKHEPGESLLPANLPGDEHRVTLDLKQLIDLSVYYTRGQTSKTRFFDMFGVGITHIFLTFKSEYTEIGSDGTFRGERDYSEYGLTVSLDIVGFELRSPDRVILTLGTRSRFVVMDSPQVIDYDNRAGRIERHELFNPNGNHMVFAYPELVATLCFRL